MEFVNASVVCKPFSKLSLSLWAFLDFPTDRSSRHHHTFVSFSFPFLEHHENLTKLLHNAIQCCAISQIAPRGRVKGQSSRDVVCINWKHPETSIVFFSKHIVGNKNASDFIVPSVLHNNNG